MISYLGAERGDLQELVVVLDHLPEELEVLHQSRLPLLVGAGDDDLTDENIFQSFLIIIESNSVLRNFQSLPLNSKYQTPKLF